MSDLHLPMTPLMQVAANSITPPQIQAAIRTWQQLYAALQDEPMHTQATFAAMAAHAEAIEAMRRQAVRDADSEAPEHVRDERITEAAEATRREAREQR